LGAGLDIGIQDDRNHWNEAGKRDHNRKLLADRKIIKFSFHNTDIFNEYIFHKFSSFKQKDPSLFCGIG